MVRVQHATPFLHAGMAIALGLLSARAQSPAPAPAPESKPSSATAFAFVGVNVIPMDGMGDGHGDRAGLLRDQTVLVDSGRITAIGPRADVRVPEGAQRIDGAGRYL